MRFFLQSKVNFVFVESSFSTRFGKAGGNSPGSQVDLSVTGHLVLKTQRREKDEKIEEKVFDSGLNVSLLYQL